MEILRIGDMRFMIVVTDDAVPGTVAKHNGNAVKITNRWKPETKLNPEYLHFLYSGLNVGEKEVVDGVECKRLDDSI